MVAARCFSAIGAIASINLASARRHSSWRRASATTNDVVGAELGSAVLSRKARRSRGQCCRITPCLGRLLVLGQQCRCLGTVGGNFNASASTLLLVSASIYHKCCSREHRTHGIDGHSAREKNLT